MFKTADGETLELAPWRMRRLLRLIANARRYPAGTPPQMLIQDLRLIISRARRVSSQPRVGTAKYQSTGACCRACLLARQQKSSGVLELVGLSIVPQVMRGLLNESRQLELEFESSPKSANLVLRWQYWNSLTDAMNGTRSAGIYMLMRGSLPVYVGMSQNLPQRLRQHLWCAVRHRDGGLSAWSASVERPQDLAAVEHALVRALGPRVSNDRLQGTLRVGPGGLTIRNLLPGGLTSARAPGNQLLLLPGAEFELAA